MEDFNYCKSIRELIIPKGVSFLTGFPYVVIDNLKDIYVTENLEISQLADAKTFENITFHGPAGCAIEQYAKENGLKFVVTETV